MWNPVSESMSKSIRADFCRLGVSKWLIHRPYNTESLVASYWMFLKGQGEFSGLVRDQIYLNNGTEGTMPKCVVDAFIEATGKWIASPTTSYETDPWLGKTQKKTRQSMAEFIGTETDNVCLTNNTTMGLSMVLNGLAFGTGDRVVITDHEHPAITAPLWLLRRRQGIEIMVRPFPRDEMLRGMNADDLLDHLLPNVSPLIGAKALCLSHVYSTNGVKLPLDTLKRKVDELGMRYLIIDGAQAFGMVDLQRTENRLDNCDFYAAPAHKWMNGPPGAGMLYIRNADMGPPEFYPTLSQKTAAYTASGHGGRSLPMAEALQVRGCQNTPAYVALIRLLRFYREIGGQAAVERHVFRLSKSVRRFIASRSPDCLVSPMAEELQSGLVSFFPFDWSHPERVFADKLSSMLVTERLQQRGIQVRFISFPTVSATRGLSDGHATRSSTKFSAVPRNQKYCVRVSTGYFNTHKQIETFKNALREAQSGLAAANDDLVRGHARLA